MFLFFYFEENATLSNMYAFLRRLNHEKSNLVAFCISNNLTWISPSCDRATRIEMFFVKMLVYFISAHVSLCIATVVAQGHKYAA